MALAALFEGRVRETALLGLKVKYVQPSSSRARKNQVRA
jgi:hypothetical protein